MAATTLRSDLSWPTDFSTSWLSAMTDSGKPRALSYTEMMNGGRQRLDQEAHDRELDLRKRIFELERKVEFLEKAFK